MDLHLFVTATLSSCKKEMYKLVKDASYSASVRMFCEYVFEMWLWSIDVICKISCSHSNHGNAEGTVVHT